MRKGEDRGEERKERRKLKGFIRKKKEEGRITMTEFNKNTFDIF